MSAAVESAMGGRPPIFGPKRQRGLVGATRVARNSACVERSWMPAGGKRAREEADIETAKFWERTDRMWDMLQNEVQKAVAKRRAAHEANMAESRRIAALHPLKKSEIEAGETEKMSPTSDKLMTPDMAPAESDIKVQTMCKSRVGKLTASRTPALCPAKVGSPVMTETALSFSRSLTFKQPSGADRNLTKAFTADPEDITLFSLYN